MKNVREFFLHIKMHSGTFCFPVTRMASCNSAVTECEQLKADATYMCQDEILEWSLLIHHVNLV